MADQNLDFSLILVDPIQELCQQWRVKFAEFSNVTIVHGYFEKIEQYDCMVSVANSFGLMDGGVDLAIIRYFGIELMHRVQRCIIEEYCGEQPVGTSFIIETGHLQHPFLAHTPTMRIPQNIANTQNVYYAMWAMLLAVRKHNRTNSRKIATVVCPGLGTATGRVPFDRAAMQMALAYKHFLHPPDRIDWRYAKLRDFLVNN